MKLLMDALKSIKEVHEYFGYKEDWRVIPLSDETEFYWTLNGEGSGGEVHFADTIEDLQDEEAGNFYSHEIYTQRFLPKFVFRGADYTMISCDTHTDGNKFLCIFDNKKEIKKEEEA